MNVRELILQDLTEISAFSRQVIDAKTNNNQKFIIKSLDGDSRECLIGLLTSLITHLEEAKTVEDLPGRDARVVECRALSLWAISIYSEIAGDPINLVPLVFISAVEFFDELIDADPTLIKMASKRFWTRLMRIALKTAIYVGSLQLKNKWFNMLLGAIKEIMRIRSATRRSTDDCNWTKREQKAVYDAAKAENTRPQTMVDSVWITNQLEFEAAAHFPSAFRGYANVESLKAVIYRNNKAAN